MAMRTTSNGICTINSPFKLNITTMVNNKAIKVSGEINGTNLSENHSFPLTAISMYLLRIPIRNGIPR